jgi:hypothetical protein
MFSKALCEPLARGSPYIVVLGWAVVCHRKGSFLISLYTHADRIERIRQEMNGCAILLAVQKAELASENLPSEQEVRAGLAALIRVGPSALWSGETQALFEIPAVRCRIVNPSDAEAPQVVQEVLEAGIHRMRSQEYRNLLTIVLGLDPTSRDFPTRERRQIAGRQFRGHTKPVSAGTIRTYHEPRALDALATVLLALEADGVPADIKRAPVPQPLENQLTCFVIGPIGDAFAAHGSPARESYEDSLRIMADVIEPACAKYGLKPVRADSLSRAGEITTQIFRRLRDDDVVIADLTDANPNVMYELGLRHTRDKLTIQIGEFARLPFDINTIRTIQFSRSPIGLITARDELIRVLETGLGGDYDPVTATRVWNDVVPQSDIAGNDVTSNTEPSQAHNEDASVSGFVDILAEAEGPQEELPLALEAVGECVVELGALAEKTTEQMRHSDSAGRGMRGRLQVITTYAASVEDIAERLDPAVDHYVSVLNAVSAGMIVLIQTMEDDPEALSQGQNFGMVSRRSAQISREAMASFAGLVKSIQSNSNASRVLKEPSRRLTSALDRFVSATSVIDEWDRRLQALGIQVPPADWTSDLGEQEVHDEGETVNDTVSGSTVVAGSPRDGDGDVA